MIPVRDTALSRVRAALDLLIEVETPCTSRTSSSFAVVRYEPISLRPKAKRLANSACSLELMLFTDARFARAFSVSSP